jgi:hypothetical protein
MVQLDDSKPDVASILSLINEVLWGTSWIVRCRQRVRAERSTEPYERNTNKRISMFLKSSKFYWPAAVIR